jgi:hypothetical protein
VVQDNETISKSNVGMGFFGRVHIILKNVFYVNCKHTYFIHKIAMSFGNTITSIRVSFHLT